MLPEIISVYAVKPQSHHRYSNLQIWTKSCACEKNKMLYFLFLLFYSLSCIYRTSKIWKQAVNIRWEVVIYLFPSPLEFLVYYI